MARKKFESINDYIKESEKSIQPVLKKVRQTIAKAAPKSEQVISYNMPAFKGERVFIYFAGFTSHIGIYPPVTKDKKLIAELKPYRNAKGNLKFPLDEKIPYALIARIAKALFKEYQSR